MSCEWFNRIRISHKTNMFNMLKNPRNNKIVSQKKGVVIWII